MTESQLHLALADWLSWQYPRALWRSDFASGLKLTPGQAVRHKRLQSSRAWPDLMIYEPRNDKQGLALELKVQGTKIYRLDGKLVADLHIREQSAMLDALRERGYEAHFAIGLDDCMKKVNDYLETPTRAFEGF